MAAKMAAVFSKKCHIPFFPYFIYEYQFFKLILTFWQPNYIHNNNKTLNSVKAGQNYYIFLVQNKK